ncbi:hypothetical protein LXA43DRAFT_1103125 [Ganoderma leucocontextum]|nr:hypothetical protein LXA43DRAFT_1103125 [Ganoderma leucocontextum]
MSSSEDTAAVVAEYASFILSDYCSNAAAALFLYEYLVTIDYEVEIFWKRRFTGASALFFLNRYLRLLFYISELVFWAALSTPTRGTGSSGLFSCATLTRFTFVFGLFAYVVWAAFSALRMLAVSSKNWFLSILVFGLSLVPFAVDLANMSLRGEKTYASLRPLVTCPTYADVELPVTIAGRTCLMAADCLLIFVTWFALSRRTLFSASPNTFAFVLLCDGTIYFVILLILNTLHLAFSVASLVTPALQNTSNLIIFVEPITAILVQRFLIHLQLANRKALHLDTSQDAGPGVGSLVFERVVGSLSASLTLDDYVSYTEVDSGSDVFEKALEESDEGPGVGDDGGGKDSIALRPVYKKAERVPIALIVNYAAQTRNPTPTLTIITICILNTMTSDSTTQPRIAIIGGGMDGLALLLSLHRRGVPTTLYERDTGFNARFHIKGTLGPGWKSGQRALRENGLQD